MSDDSVVVDVRRWTGTAGYTSDVIGTHKRERTRGTSWCGTQKWVRLTFRARDGRTALIWFLLDLAIFADRLDEGAHSKVAHQHPVVASAVQARFVRYYSIALVVVLEVVVATRCVSNWRETQFHCFMRETRCGFRT